MWSLGCVAAELFLGWPLFPGTSEYDQVSQGGGGGGGKGRGEGGLQRRGWMMVGCKSEGVARGSDVVCSVVMVAVVM